MTTGWLAPLLNIRMVKPSSYKSGIQLDLRVRGKPLQMELDTGASVSLISKATWKNRLKSPRLSPSEIRLKTYSGEALKVLGQCMVEVRYGEQTCQAPLVVVAGHGPSLFGRNWLEKIRLEWGSIQSITTTPVEELLHEYAEVFSSDLGTIQGVEAHLEVQEGATPRFHRPRSVPYALRGVVEQDLERLERLGVIEKVQYSDWAAPIVPVPKGDGGIRICGDYKVTVNPVLKVDQYPVPTAEDLFATLAGGQTFTKLDLSHAYQQVRLDPESRKYVTINTHKGLYQYTRLPFGVASAPAVFQQIMEKILHGIPRVVVYLDDILITGRDDAEHLRILRQVLGRLKRFGIKLKRAKCRLMQPRVDYLGYRIDKHGLHTMPDKVAAIQEAPRPGNVKELRAFLGLVQYYGRFIRNLSTVTQPLNKLLCKGVPWRWSEACDSAFQKLKAALASSEVLAHYDPELPVKLDCDASAYGVGAVLSHTFPDGSERPIAYASRTLSAPERNYAQIEKEGLSLIWGVKKFHKYLYGRLFTLVTDHKPLLAILGSKKGLPTLAAARLQRWAIFLLGYQYVLEFRSTTKHCNADGFSRLPRVTAEGESDKLVAEATSFNVHQINALPLSAKQLAAATSADPELSRVVRYCCDGWPASVSKELQPYFQKREEMSIEGECLFRGTQVIIPTKLRPQVLTELHTSHPGIVRMKGLARSRVWWPGVAGQIEEKVRSCTACQEHRNQPAPVPLQPWPWAKTPWERIHIDFAGPVEGVMYLVIVDSYSKWVEVEPMRSTTTEKTLDVLRMLFARYGLPKHLVSDNGPQFTSTAFTQCMQANGIRHSRSAPYHPATNGAAERVVQTFKNFLRTGKDDSGSQTQKLAQFLLVNRTTPHSTTGVPPANLFLKRSLRTRLDIMRPSVDDKVNIQQERQKRYHDSRAQDREIEAGQEVMARNFRDGPKWVKGKVVKKIGAVMFEVRVGDGIWRRHANQLLRYRGHPEEPESEVSPETAVNEDDEVGPETTLGSGLSDYVTNPEPVPEETVESTIVDNSDNSESDLPGSSPVADALATPVTQPTPITRPTSVTHPVPVTRSYPRRNRGPPTRFDPSFF